eukprot:9724015-Heterocapsa_arctica.AAC.1
MIQLLLGPHPDVLVLRSASVVASADVPPVVLVLFLLAATRKNTRGFLVHFRHPYLRLGYSSTCQRHWATWRPTS